MVAIENEKQNRLTFPGPTRAVPGTTDWGELELAIPIKDHILGSHTQFTAWTLTISLFQGIVVQNREDKSVISMMNRCPHYSDKHIISYCGMQTIKTNTNRKLFPDFSLTYMLFQQVTLTFQVFTDLPKNRYFSRFSRYSGNHK